MEKIVEHGFQERALEATARLLERNGCEIVDERWSDGAADWVVANDDDGTLVFVEVVLGMTESEVDSAARREMEEAAGRWLSGHLEDVPESRVRFDRICIMPLEGEDGDYCRALVRHRVNVLG